MSNKFFDKQENEVIQQFLENGYVIFPLEDYHLLDKIRAQIFKWSLNILQTQIDSKEEIFFNNTHHHVRVEELNEFRLKIIAEIVNDPDLRSDIYSLAKTYIGWIVGNELAMQRNCNLSLQLPHDDSSLLPLHTDVWSGNSPYEIVFWFSLVDCYRTKSIFILPKPDSEKILDNFHQYYHFSTEQLYQTIKHDLIWLEVPYGSGVIFSHTLFHGGRVNEEDESRWSFNVRFKSLLSPYAMKEMGESFLPITIRPATRFGYNYKKPKMQ